MGQLFGRKWNVQVGDLATDQLAVKFEIDRSVKLDVNTAKVWIYNLNAQDRARVAAVAPLVIPTERRQLTVEAGYPEDFGLIFQGDVVRVRSHHADTDWSTLVEAGDGELAMRTSASILSLAPGSDTGDLAARLIDNLGKRGKRLIDKLKNRDYPGAVQEFKRGLAHAGHTADLMRELATMTGLDLSIQSGEVIGLAPGESTSDPALLISPTSGLLGFPELAEGSTVATSKVAGLIRIETMMLPGLFPGRAVRLQSDEGSGDFIAARCIYKGDTNSADEWGILSELVPSQPFESISAIFDGGGDFSRAPVWAA